MKKTIIITLIFATWFIFIPSALAIDKVENVKIRFVNDARNNCGETLKKEPFLAGCYSYKDKKIFITKFKEYKGEKAWLNEWYMQGALYHEMGHHLFKENFPKNLFSDAEEMATKFGAYVALMKEPWIYYKQAELILSQDQWVYFNGKLSKEEYNKLISIKIINK